MAKLKYLRISVTNANFIHDEIKNRLSYKNAWNIRLTIYYIPISYES
jgi:hypothetical protein